jgi:hypothetical protein
MAALPKEIAYNRPMASLPADTSSLNVIVRPSNGSQFQAGGDIIQFDLPAHSFLVPSSLTLRGRTRVLAGTDTASDLMWGVPAASWIQRVETIVGGNLIESIQSYGQLYNMISQTKLNVAEKYGLATELGYVGGATGSATGALTVDNLNGRSLNATAATDAAPFSFALPLGCLLSSCAELVPLGLIGGVRIQITTAALADYIEESTATNAPTVTFEDLELNFDLVSFGAGMDGVVASMANADGDILMKSQGWNVNSINTSTAASQSQDLIFNTRLSSIKSLIYQGSGSYGTNWGTKPAAYGAMTVAGASGSTQFFVASTPFPPTPLREAFQASIMSELRQAQGAVHDVYSTTASISPQQFITAPQLATAAAALVYTAPPSHFIGVNCEKLSTNAVMLSGVSSQLSPINVRLQSSAASANDFTSTLFCLYDAIISINIPTRTMNVRV